MSLRWERWELVINQCMACSLIEVAVFQCVQLNAKDASPSTTRLTSLQRWYQPSKQRCRPLSVGLRQLSSACQWLVSARNGFNIVKSDFAINSHQLEHMLWQWMEISVENRKIFHPCTLRLRCRSSPWKLVSALGVKKLEWWCYQRSEKF